MNPPVPDITTLEQATLDELIDEIMDRSHSALFVLEVPVKGTKGNQIVRPDVRYKAGSPIQAIGLADFGRSVLQGEVRAQMARARDENGGAS